MGPFRHTMAVGTGWFQHSGAGRLHRHRRAPGWWRSALARSVLPVLLVALLPCSSAAQAPDEHDPAVSIHGTDLIKVGYLKDLLPDVDPRDAQVAVEMWLMELAAELGLPVKTQIHFYGDMPSLVEALAADRIEVATLPPLDYLEVRKRVALDVFIVGEVQGRVTDEHLILVRGDGGFSALEDLRESALIVESGRYASLTASMWLETLLLKKGLGGTRAFFGTVKLASKASQALLGVLFRKYDAGLVTRRAFETMAELNPQIGQELTVLHHSPGFLREVLCGRKGFDTKWKQAMLETALRLRRYARGRQVLELFGMDRVVRFDPAYLEPIIGLVKEYEGLKSRP